MHRLKKGKYKYFNLLLNIQLIMLLLHGCIAIPTPDHGGGADLKIGKTDAGFIEPQKTSFEDIIVEFGPPSFYIPENRVLAYSWKETEGYFLGVHPMGIPVAGSIPSPHLFLIEIDEGYLVKRFEELEIDRDVDLKAFARKWSTAEQ
jgi:hypothetical protein